MRNEESTEPYLAWCGGFICIVLAIVALVVLGNGWLRLGSSLPADAAGPVVELQQQPDRSSCAEVGISDLRSPAEGLWFQSNCIPTPEPPLVANQTNCNRTSLDPAEFTPVAPGLFVTHQKSSSPGFLWYASSDTCFDLVTARIVTAVCADETVSFDWNIKAACASHGGVLARINGS